MLLMLVLRSLVGSTYRGATASTGIEGVDFRTTYMAAARLKAGEPLYLDEKEAKSGGNLICQFTCSPLIPMLFQPFVKQPWEQSMKIWAGINVTVLAVATFLFCWGSRVRILDNPAPALLVMFSAFRYWPTVIEVALGNTHLLLLGLVCGMIVCNRYQSWLAMAILVAIGALVKTWMIGMIFPFLVMRRWREAAVAVILFVIGLGVLCLFNGGTQTLAGFFAVTHAYSSEPGLISHSVSGLARQYFTENLLIAPLVKSQWAWFAAMLIGYGIIITGLAILFIRGRELDEKQRQLSIALSALALILGSPVSHIMYFPLALPTIWTLLCRPWPGRHSLAAPIAAFSMYLLLTIPWPCVTPVPESYRTGPRSLLLAMIFLPSASIWIYGVLLARTRDDENLSRVSD